MACKMVVVNFDKRERDLYYMVKYELKPDRQWKRQEMRIMRAIELGNMK
ncbi:MAG: hypothetical protein WC823_00685 [Parcubacteria group bacterium]|jgi:hypothetical protein